MLKSSFLLFILAKGASVRSTDLSSSGTPSIEGSFDLDRLRERFDRRVDGYIGRDSRKQLIFRKWKIMKIHEYPQLQDRKRKKEILQRFMLLQQILLVLRLI